MSEEIPTCPHGYPAGAQAECEDCARGPAAKAEATSEIIVESLDEAADRASAHFSRLQSERYGLEGKEPKDLHNEKHSAGVAAGAVAVWDRLSGIDPDLFPPGEWGIVQVLGMGHDSVQVTKVENGRLVRARGFREGNRDTLAEKGFSVGNEEASAEEIIEEMRRYRTPNGEAVFPVNDPAFAERVRLAIGATYPELPKTFVEKLPDTEGGKMALKIFQPFLKPESDPWALVLAVEDLRGPVGSGTFEVFRQSGEEEFREINPWVREAALADAENVSPDIRKSVAVEILKWKRGQEGFGRWQRVLFDKAIKENRAIGESANAEDIRRAFRERYSRFEENIQAAAGHYKNLEERFGSPENPKELNGESFRELLGEMGYAE